VTRWLALAMLLVGCGADPVDAGDLMTGTLCGFVESDEGPHVSPHPEWCTIVTVLSPSGGLLTRESATACDVSSMGSTCLALALGEPFRAWTPLRQSAEHLDWYWEPVACDAACP